MKHTIFGEVINGMDAVNAIENSQRDSMDKPIDDQKIISISVEE